MYKRGEIWLANLDPSRGTEPGKTRPVLIVQSQALLDAEHPSTLILPLTTNLVEDAEPLRIRIPPSGRLRRESDLLVDQLRAIDNRRLIQGPLARLGRVHMLRVDEAIREALDLVQFGKALTSAQPSNLSSTLIPGGKKPSATGI